MHPRWCRISEPSTVFHGISQGKFSGGTPWPRTADDAPHASKLLRGSKVAIYSDLFPPGTVTPNGGGLERESYPKWWKHSGWDIIKIQKN